MKIISQIPGNRVLVSLKEDELANILGHYSGSKLTRDFYTDVMTKETEIDVSDIYKKHSEIVNLQNKSDYDTARRKLQDILDALTPIESKVKKLPVK